MKTALVTGGAKNLGKAIAVNLAKQGFNIAIHYNTSEKEAEISLKEIKKYSDGFLIQGDLTDPKKVDLIFQKIEKSIGKVDILVNLIGSFIFTPIDKTGLLKFKDVIETNLYSTFLCCQRALPQMKKNKWGRIINFGCVGAESLTIRKNTTPYYIAKTGVIMLTKVFAFEYAKHNITINSISPGILKSSIVKTTTPSGRLADFSDITNAINFLLKEESNYINGANIEVAGAWRPRFY